MNQFVSSFHHQTGNNQSNNNASKSSMLVTQQQQQPVVSLTSNATATTEAFIVNSNSNIVTDEVLMQLQEQFGDSKQIFILNSGTNSVSTASGSVVNGLAHSGGTSSSNGPTGSSNNVQYLVVDKDVDINIILQDPNILQHCGLPHGNNTIVKNKDVYVPNGHHMTNNNGVVNSVGLGANTNANNIVASSSAVSANNNLEEVQRVQAPPPKRKKFEYKWDPSKKMTYQDAFLRYLAGEKQPTLENSHFYSTENSPTSSQVSKKPKDAIYYNFYSKLIPNVTTNNHHTVPSSINIPNSSYSNIIAQSSQVVSSSLVSTVANNNTASNITTTAATPTTTTVVNNDKENFYNSSRRENLTSHEYRNSYKDHYDNQGVRINPAMLKNLNQQFSVTSSTTLPPAVAAATSSQTTTPIATPNTSVTTQITVPRATSGNKQRVNKSVNSIGDNGVYKVTYSRKNNIHSTNVASSSSYVAVPQPLPPTQPETIIIIDDDASDSPHNQVQFVIGEFLIHIPTFSGDLDNYDIWCVLDSQFLQKYEPVLLVTGERCHQSADILAHYAPNKNEFLLVKCEEKGKTESNNIVVSILSEYDPKTNPKIAECLLGSSFNNNKRQQHQVVSNTAAGSANSLSQSSSSTQEPPTQSESAHQIEPHKMISTPEELVHAEHKSHDLKFKEYKSSFDLYLQALCSQSLGTDLLSKENEYLKSSIELIDNTLAEKYVKLDSLLSEQFLSWINQKLQNHTIDLTHVDSNIQLRQQVKHLLETRPMMTIEERPPPPDTSVLSSLCDLFVYPENMKDSITHQLSFLTTTSVAVRFTGAQYDTNTLCVNINDHQAEIEFNFCQKSFKFVNMLHSLKHFKFNLHRICSQKIDSKKCEEEANSLSECLSTPDWQLDEFVKYTNLLNEVDSFLSQISSEIHRNDDDESMTIKLEQEKCNDNVNSNNTIELPPLTDQLISS